MVRGTVRTAVEIAVPACDLAVTVIECCLIRSVLVDATASGSGEQYSQNLAVFVVKHQIPPESESGFLQ